MAQESGFHGQGIGSWRWTPCFGQAGGWHGCARAISSVPSHQARSPQFLFFHSLSLPSVFPPYSYPLTLIDVCLALAKREN